MLLGRQVVPLFVRYDDCSRRDECGRKPLVVPWVVADETAEVLAGVTTKLAVGEDALDLPVSQTTHTSRVQTPAFAFPVRSELVH